MRFENKRVLVTGAGSGIGRAVCLAFAQEGGAVAGADMNLEAARATAQNVTNTHGKACALQLDVTQPDSVNAVVDRTGKELGGIDILVNSAGVREIVAFLELPFAEWQRVISTNLRWWHPPVVISKAPVTLMAPSPFRQARKLAPQPR